MKRLAGEKKGPKEKGSSLLLTLAQNGSQLFNPIPQFFIFSNRFIRSLNDTAHRAVFF
jgi:hypothetical protein